MTPTLLLAIAIGGAAGSVGRYLLATAVTQVAGAGWPWGTLTVNVIGGLAIGLIAEMLVLRWQGGPELRAFLVTGILGGFTTFSAFSLEAVALIARDAWSAALAYVAVSVVLSLAATALGIAMARWLA
jgi:CrcB protein